MNSFTLVRLMSKSKSSLTPPAVKPNGPVFTDKNGDIVVQVLAKPGAKSNAITTFDTEGIGIQINARPVDGEANNELVKYITSVLGLKKNEISLNKGMKSRQKVLLISSKEFTAEKVIQILKSEMK